MEARETASRRNHQNDQAILEQIASLDLPELRGMLIEWLGDHLSDRDDLLNRTLPGLREAIYGLTDPDLESLRQAYLSCGEDVIFYPIALSGRRLGHAFLSEIPIHPTLVGFDNLKSAFGRGPTLIVSNHLSYADSQFTEYLTARLGSDDVARKLTFIAGPKVYEDPFRRMAAVSLNTIPTAQSTRLGYNRAEQSQREVARIALKTIRLTYSLMNQGYLVLLYAEGTRSRSGRLGSFLKATCRYADVKGLHIVPAALTGTEIAFPVHEYQLRRAEISVTFGEPIPVGDRGPATAMTTAWDALAELLPAERRPTKGTAPLI